MKTAPLVCEIKDERLVISVGVDTLAEAIEKDWNNWDIVNHENFTKDLIKAMVREDSNGNSLITSMVSLAAQNVFNKDKKEEKDEWWVVNSR